MSAVHLGSGLGVSDGSGYSTAQLPTAFPLPDGSWRAEISGVQNGAVVRSWIGPIFEQKADALAAARAQMGESQ